MPRKPNDLPRIDPDMSSDASSSDEDAYFSPDSDEPTTTGSDEHSDVAKSLANADSDTAKQNTTTNKVDTPLLTSATKDNEQDSSGASSAVQDVPEPDATTSGPAESHPSQLLNDPMDIDPAYDRKHLDLLPSIKGLFRVLDLFSENASGGMVNKIIIDQGSMKHLVNTFSPGAYSSLTKARPPLDKVLVKPLGIYGSKSEIVDFLASSGAIDEEKSRALLQPWSDVSPHLRSGLYVLRASETRVDDTEQIFVVYWPEDTTWNDDATSAVRRNRVTFMRYLTQISDQTVCLISPEHARSVVWNDEPEEAGLVDFEDEAADRMFAFEVAKTNEQEEDVSVRSGFAMSALIAAASPPPPERELDLQPFLVAGETAVSILTKTFVAATPVERRIPGEVFSPIKLRNLLSVGPISLSPELSDDAVRTLGQNSLDVRCPAAFKDWKSRNEAGLKDVADSATKEEQAALQQLQNNPKLEPVIREAVVDQILQLFPSMQRTLLSPVTGDELVALQKEFVGLTAVHPTLKDDISKLRYSKSTSEKFEHLPSPELRQLKDQINCLDILFTQRPDILLSDREQIVKHVSEHGAESLTRAYNLRGSKESKDKGIIKKFFALFSAEDHSTLEGIVRAQLHERRGVSDGTFLSTLDRVMASEPQLESLVMRAVAIAEATVQSALPRTVTYYTNRAVSLQQDLVKAQINRKSAAARAEFLQNSRKQFNEELTGMHFTLRAWTPQLYMARSYKITAVTRWRRDPFLCCRLYPLRLTEDDLHRAQLNDDFVPVPHISQSFACSFDLKLDTRIIHAQLLDKDRLLLVLVDSERFYIFHEPLSFIERAVSRGGDGAKRVVHTSKVGKDALFAYEEQKRLLSLCSVSNLQLHLYQFDETFTSLQGWGTAFDLGSWYVPGSSPFKSCFVAGCEELLVVDSSGLARIFSLITQQFRPASLLFTQLPETLRSSPDGACLVVSARDGDRIGYRCYHWDTFGSSEGIGLGELDLPQTPAAVISLVSRRKVHLVALDSENCLCRSMVLDIKKKATEFMFKEMGAKSASKAVKDDAANNCLINVHADVWTRFPVVAAVQRQTVSASHRRPRRLLFVSERNHEKYPSHFKDLINNFEQKTRKPTGDVLHGIRVSAVSHMAFYGALSTSIVEELSVLKAGEWVVDLLCLIPIQIALTRDNRFLPPQGRGAVCGAGAIPTWRGSWSDCRQPELWLVREHLPVVHDIEGVQSLVLTVDLLMAFQPVKVVSSMGEQSVGKSYSLNHLCDTSFAGSAMRTTEGVWMSVTPTDEALIVALDFEGVHSIERSAQEDTLLVLFNTSLSNLVLFRNNFAMSRSISGLFQSFQSSSTVLDPAANPTLFKSRLAIIIKDVVESDTKEIVREFSTKFQKIVEDEQDANFISRLHAGQLNIIPWPVIESRQFYALFPSIKRLLDRQQVTHRTAGEFLHTIKTLMAKLKANDWGALSQNLAAHRSQKLLMGLRNALIFGLYEAEPEEEPLKNFDTDEPIDLPDTHARFFLSEKDSSLSHREKVLVTLRNSWDQIEQRPHRDEAEWFEELTQYLNAIVDMRIEHVREWIVSNLSRFTESQATMEVLRRMFETYIVDLRANVELCGTQQSHPCSASCQLPGTCEIETAPQSIEATFTGRHETFQYTKYSQVAKRLECVFPIPPGEKAHAGPHCHSADQNPFHYCQARCENCGYFCTLPRGHPQQEHETRHGSMSRTQWTVDGPDDAVVELNGRKFGASDEGSPLLCSLYCQDMGRHAHLDYCRADDAHSCTGAETEHIQKRVLPNPDRPKDWVSHSLFWRRSGFKDPYSRPDQLNFSKCDAMCPDTDHVGDATTAPNPSYCVLPLFHAPATQATGLGYLSNDGHVFNCKNPAVLQHAYHVIFVIDRSGSMGARDRQPLANTPVTALISQHANNRLGAVYSALHSFWGSRNTALNAGAQQTAGVPARRDAYSVVLFDDHISTAIANDFTRSPDRLLADLVQYQARGGTNFTLAIQHAQSLMETHWSTERTPVVIFLSDGQCTIGDETMRAISRRAIALGKPLSFHAVSFGPAHSSDSLRRMAQVALEVQSNAPRDPLVPAAATIASSYSEALDTVRLAETFLGFAESLRKPRGALMSSTK
ncbi:VWFA domain-containing protein [Mycena chlorophos]|uniref:VWFA domain-containing protein n=1 Tax=Mycena chlorophos TaxID=658473 RepID=A0A8H6SY02_MYCCL|nr:VWFA domain-containing protein [Mycena chlorophos]